MKASDGMTQTDYGHDHIFLGLNHERNERRTWFVIALTSVMMVVEIAAGTIYGSMALVADGWHMSTHAAAMLIAALAYLYARHNAKNPRFTFGTGKVGDLAAFASAIVLALVALLIGWESVVRLANPVPISFPRLFRFAVIGLIVDLSVLGCCAKIMVINMGISHDHGHHMNIMAGIKICAQPYLHVLADALTSVLAIIALIAGSIYGWIWLDPFMGIVGALVIARWSWGLMRDTGATMLDYRQADDPFEAKIRSVVEEAGDQITDLHVWKLGPGHRAAIVAVRTESKTQPAVYRERLAKAAGLSHITVEVNTA